MPATRRVLTRRVLTRRSVASPVRPRRGDPRAARAALLLLAAPLGRAAAQTTTLPTRHVLDAAHAWFTYDGDHPLTSRVGIAGDVQVRRADFVDTWQQFMVRGGVRYYWTRQASLTAGYAWIRTWGYGDEPATPHPFPEHRTYEQLQVRATSGRVVWTQRFRLEQRWLANLNGGGDVTSWRYTNRARMLIRAQLPLQGATTEPKEFYAAASTEPFVSWGRNVRGNVFDQNRAALLLGYQLSRVNRVEGGYLNQLILRGDGATVERNHTLQVTFASSAPLLPGGRRAVR